MRRVQRDATMEDFIQQLCDSKTGYFSEIWRLLLFAALLGKARGRRERLEKVDTGKSIDPKVFGNSPLWPGVVHLIGLLHDGSPDSLRQDRWDDSLLIFEEYANGGLREMQEADRASSLKELLIVSHTTVIQTDMEALSVKTFRL